MPRPNVLLITIDTLRADRLGCYGYPKGLTLNLDRLAAEGLCFDQAITGGSWTQAAFPVLLTSTHASMYGGCLGPLSPERPSLIEALSENGYSTGAFISSPLLGRAYGYQRGFGYFDELIPVENDPVLRKLRGGQRLLRIPLTHYTSRLLGQCTRPARLYVSAEQINQAAFQWLDYVQEPFFGWIHYMDVHWPYHREEILTNPHDIAQTWKDVAHMHALNWLGAQITPAQYDRYIELYEQAVHYTDTQVGLLFSYLEQLGYGDNTIIVVVSDHGEEFLERRHWGHFETNLYDEIIRVPLIIRLPDHPGGQIVKRQVRTMDIMPTVLELCKCPTPKGTEGISHAPFLNGREDNLDRLVAISERWRNVGDVSHKIAVRTEEFKYILDINHPDQAELYDLEMDPGENTNIIKKHPVKVRELHIFVDELLDRAAQTKPQNLISEPELTQDVVERLRGLGYIE